MEGRISIFRHHKVTANPLLASKEGRSLIEDLIQDICRLIVTHVAKFLERRVESEGAHLRLDTKEREQVLSELERFKNLAIGYEDGDNGLGEGDGEDATVAWKTSVMSTQDRETLARFAPPVLHGRVRSNGGFDGDNDVEAIKGIQRRDLGTYWRSLSMHETTKTLVVGNFFFIRGIYWASWFFRPIIIGGVPPDTRPQGLRYND